MTRIARYQIRKNLKHFLKKLGRCSAGERSLKLKYLMELSAVEPNYGSECFITSSSCVRVSGEGGIQIYSSDSKVTKTSLVAHLYHTITTPVSHIFHTHILPLHTQISPVPQLGFTFTTPTSHRYHTCISSLPHLYVTCSTPVCHRYHTCISRSTPACHRYHSFTTCLVHLYFYGIII